jgi:hypothetical protein
MKKPLLTGIAALFLATGATQAADLPAEMLGPWCYQYSYQFPNDQGAFHLWRFWNGHHIKDVDDCANRGGLNFRSDGYDYARFGPGYSCQFTAIEFLRHGKPEDRLHPSIETMPPMMTDASPSDVFIVRATCKTDPAVITEREEGEGPTDEDTWTESFEIRTANDWLRIEEINEG